MSELGQRLGVALLLIPVVVAAIWVGDWALAALLALAGGAAAWEFCRLATAAGSRPMVAVAVLLSAAAPLTVHAARHGGWLPGLTLVLLVVPALFTAALWLRGTDGRPLESVATTVLAVLYTGALLAFAYPLRYHEYVIGAAAGTAVLMLPVLLTWATDTGAFLVGRLVGGPKLFPSVSPGKTVSGGVGGVLVAVAVALAYVRWLLVPVAKVGMTVPGTILFAVLLSVGGQLGDLVESLLKRQAGVKDSSRLLPGHGGVLDRVDSLLFALPLGFLLLGALLVPAFR